MVWSCNIVLSFSVQTIKASVSHIFCLNSLFSIHHNLTGTVQLCKIKVSFCVRMWKNVIKAGEGMLNDMLPRILPYCPCIWPTRILPAETDWKRTELVADAEM